MSHVSALLLDDALLKCVVTEMVLFSVVAFKTLDIHCTHLPIPLFSLGWRIGPTKVSALESRVGWTPARNNERTTLDISQGSVATQLRCGWIFRDSIITNFLLILRVNNFENCLIFSKLKACENVPIFWPPCMLIVTT